MATPTSATLKDVKIFATGSFGRDKYWSLSDLGVIVNNAKRIGSAAFGSQGIPLVLGHGDGPDGDDPEPQSYLDATGLPACGWIDPQSVKVIPFKDDQGTWQGHLVATFTDIPPAVAAMIRAKRYRYISAELYPSYIDDQGRSHGPALRRVALLGGAPGAVKSLGPVPDPVYHADRLSFVRCVPRRRTAVYTFLEVMKVDRQQLYAAVQSVMPSLSQAFLDGLSDDALAELAKCLPTQDTDAANAKMDDTNGDMDAAGPPTPGMLEKARQFAAKHSEAIRKAGSTKEKFVAKFSEISRKRGRGVAASILK